MGAESTTTPLPADSLPAGATTGLQVDTQPDSVRTPVRPSPLPQPQPQGSARAAGDTLRGTLLIVGAEPLTDVVLRPATGRSVSLTGDLRDELRALSGVEIWISGTHVPGPRPSFVVARYAVRTVDGVRAIDGVLATDGDGLALITADGRRHRLTRVPEALRAQVGARVWVSGEPPTEIASYGIIRPRS
jgi:hypothetical protein